MTAIPVAGMTAAPMAGMTAAPMAGTGAVAGMGGTSGGRRLFWAADYGRRGRGRPVLAVRHPSCLKQPRGEPHLGNEFAIVYE